MKEGAEEQFRELVSKLVAMEMIQVIKNIISCLSAVPRGLSIMIKVMCVCQLCCTCNQPTTWCSHLLRLRR